MSIIISQHGKNATRLDRTEFGLEERIQEYIHENPESIPLYDIREDIQLLILAREFATGSGPIDAVAIDQDGQLYLVETKLYKNADKRTVLAQVLDYGASLWKYHTNFDDFVLQLNRHVQLKWNLSVSEKIQEYFQLDETQTHAVLDAMQSHLGEGSFKFVVLMDTLHDRLKDLILYVNQNSKFDVYGVELEYYQHENFEILIPKLFGAEVKKEVVARKPSSSMVTNEEFLELFASIGLDHKLREVLDLLEDMQQGSVSIHSWTARRTPKSLSFTYKLPDNKKQSLTVSIGYNHGSPQTALDFWLYDKSLQDNLEFITLNAIQQQTTALSPHLFYGRVLQWPLETFSRTAFTAFMQSLASST